MGSVASKRRAGTGCATAAPESAPSTSQRPTWHRPSASLPCFSIAASIIAAQAAAQHRAPPFRPRAGDGHHGTRSAQRLACVGRVTKRIGLGTDVTSTGALELAGRYAGILPTTAEQEHVCARCVLIATAARSRRPQAGEPPLAEHRTDCRRQHAGIWKCIRNVWRKRATVAAPPRACTGAGGTAEGGALILVVSHGCGCWACELHSGGLAARLVLEIIARYPAAPMSPFSLPFHSAATQPTQPEPR